MAGDCFSVPAVHCDPSRVCILSTANVALSSSAQHLHDPSRYPNPRTVGNVDGSDHTKARRTCFQLNVGPLSSCNPALCRVRPPHNRRLTHAASEAEDIPGSLRRLGVLPTYFQYRRGGKNAACFACRGIFVSSFFPDVYLSRSLCLDLYRDAKKGCKKLGGLVLPELAYDDRAAMLPPRSESVGLIISNSICCV